MKYRVINNAEERFVPQRTTPGGEWFGSMSYPTLKEAMDVIGDWKADEVFIPTVIWSE